MGEALNRHMPNASRIPTFGGTSFWVKGPARLDSEKLASQILIGSVRHLMDVNEALQDGAHVVTVPPPILRKMLWNPRTESTIEEFNTAWRNRQR